RVGQAVAVGRGDGDAWGRSGRAPGGGHEGGDAMRGCSMPCAGSPGAGGFPVPRGRSRGGRGCGAAAAAAAVARVGEEDGGPIVAGRLNTGSTAAGDTAATAAAAALTGDADSAAPHRGGGGGGTMVLSGRRGPPPWE
ncbi:unnamed protein product, partial [Ectocarpus fasciculatus]